MIARHWRGLAEASQADAYIQYLRTETFPAIARIHGFVDASMLRRSLTEGVEFLVVTRWASMDAIRAFAGNDAETAVVPRKVRAMMLDYDRVVRHFEVVEPGEP